MTRIGIIGLIIRSSALITQVAVVAASHRTALWVDAGVEAAALPEGVAVVDVGICRNSKALAERFD